MISGRLGLWVIDLTVTQILQEKVAEEHRGIIGGVQNSMNSAMDTIKFILVIVLPENKTFGWLVIASFVFVSFGAFSYIYYAIFQHEKITLVKEQNSNNDVVQSDEKPDVNP